MIDNLLESSLQTLKNELTKLANLSHTETDPLDQSQATTLNNYVKTLLLASKSEREAQVLDLDSVATLSDMELNALAVEALNFLENEGELANKPTKKAKPKKKQGSKSKPKSLKKKTSTKTKAKTEAKGGADDDNT